MARTLKKKESKKRRVLRESILKGRGKKRKLTSAISYSDRTDDI